MHGDPLVLTEWLFLETMKDLRRRCANPAEADRYTLLGIAPLLRKLIIDPRNLASVAHAGRYAVPLRFRIAPYQLKPSQPKDEQGHGRTLVVSFARDELAPTNAAKPLLLKDFIHIPVGEVEGSLVTVRDLVRYFAHVEGGVHVGRPKTEAERALIRYTPLLVAYKGTIWVDVLAYIGAIVIEAMGPLENAIANEPFAQSRVGSGIEE